MEDGAPFNRWLWPRPDRLTLYRAIVLLAADRVRPPRVAVCINVLFSDLELYDDPRQGLGHWLTQDEYVLSNALTERLYEIRGVAIGYEAGEIVLNHPDWPETRRLIIQLRDLIEANGPNVAAR